MKTTTRFILAVSIVTFISSFTSVYAQESKVQSVIISVSVEGIRYNSNIEIIKPDYSTETKKDISKEDIQVTFKKELDNWLEQGYIIKESNTSHNVNGYPITRYILVKE